MKRENLTNLLEKIFALACACIINLATFGALALYTEKKDFPQEKSLERISSLKVKEVIRREQIRKVAKKEKVNKASLEKTEQIFTVPETQVAKAPPQISLTSPQIPGFSTEFQLELADLPMDFFSVTDLAAENLSAEKTVALEKAVAKTSIKKASSRPTHGPYSLGEVDKGPVPLYAPKPSYPESARKRGLSGRVVVLFIVDKRGRVINPQVQDATGGRAFEQAVLSALKGWRFGPARKNGRPVAVRCKIAFTFKIKEP